MRSWSAPKRSLDLRSLAVCSLFTSCATVPPYINPQLPANTLQHFVECASSDGALSLQIWENQKFREQYDLEWAAKGNGDFALESYTPFGQTVLSLKFVKANQNFAIMGPKLPAMESLQIDKEEFLQFRSHRIALKPEEFPCFFQGKMPRSWLKQVVTMSADSQFLALTVQEKGRLQNLRIGKQSNDSPLLWEVETIWQSYWGLSEEKVIMQHFRDRGLVIRSQRFPTEECRILPKENEE